MTKISHTDTANGDLTRDLNGTGKGSVLLKIGLVISSLALILTVVSSSFPDWLTVTLPHPLVTSIEIRVGIFYMCTSTDGCDGSDSDPADWQHAAAGVHATGMLLALATVVGVVIQVARPCSKLAGRLKIPVILTCCGASLFILLAAILLYTHNEDVPNVPSAMDFDWALILSTVNGCLLSVTGVLLIVGILL